MDVSRCRTTRSTGRDPRDAASSSAASPLQRRRRAPDRSAAGEHDHGPLLGPRPGSVCPGVAAGGPAVRRGGPGAVANTRAGPLGEARIGAVRRARTRAVGIARGNARREPLPRPSNPLRHRRVPMDRRRRRPGHRHRSLLSRRPPTRSTVRRRQHRQLRPRARGATASPWSRPPTSTVMGSWTIW